MYAQSMRSSVLENTCTPLLLTTALGVSCVYHPALSIAYRLFRLIMASHYGQERHREAFRKKGKNH